MVKHTLTLTIDVAGNVDPDGVITDINCAILCAMEEDTHQITGWAWDTKSTVIAMPKEG